MLNGAIVEDILVQVRKLQKATGVVVEGSECDNMCIVRLDDREMCVSRLSVEATRPILKLFQDNSRYLKTFKDIQRYCNA